MADMNKLVPIILNFEGGYVNDKADKGGATNHGITIETFRLLGADNDGDGDIDVRDLQMITEDQWKKIFRIYWNRWKADQINNQSIANILVDWVWASGKFGITIPQRLLGLQTDGIVGKITLEAVNSADGKVFFDSIRQARLDYVNNIIYRNPMWRKFEKGWKRRINYYTYYD